MRFFFTTAASKDCISIRKRRGGGTGLPPSRAARVPRMGTASHPPGQRVTLTLHSGGHCGQMCSELEVSGTGAKYRLSQGSRGAVPPPPSAYMGTLEGLSAPIPPGSYLATLQDEPQHLLSTFSHPHPGDNPFGNTCAFRSQGQGSGSSLGRM